MLSLKWMMKAIFKAFSLMDYIMIITDVSVDHEDAHILIVVLGPEGINTVDVSRLIKVYMFLICSPMNWV